MQLLGEVVELFECLKFQKIKIRFDFFDYPKPLFCGLGYRCLLELFQQILESKTKYESMHQQLFGWLEPPQQVTGGDPGDFFS